MASAAHQLQTPEIEIGMAMGVAQDLEARRGIRDARRVDERRASDRPRAAQVASADGNELVSDAQILGRPPEQPRDVRQRAGVLGACEEGQASGRMRAHVPDRERHAPEPEREQRPEQQPVERAESSQRCISRWRSRRIIPTEAVPGVRLFRRQVIRTT